MAKSSTQVAVKTGGEAEARKEYSRPVADLRSEIDKLFEDFSSSFNRGPLGWRFSDVEPFRGFPASFELSVPAIDVSETDKGYQITAELPGMGAKDVDLSISDNMLTVKGEKREQREEKEKDYYLSERRYGSFQRSFRLPEGVDDKKISASLHDGVLTISLPKITVVKKARRKISVEKKGAAKPAKAQAKKKSGKTAKKAAKKPVRKAATKKSK